MIWTLFKSDWRNFVKIDPSSVFHLCVGLWGFGGADLEMLRRV